MSEFKFACPVCGQHITADSSTSGGRLECPTCFQQIVVPQAPASADSKLIVSASQVGKPRPVSSGTASDAGLGQGPPARPSMLAAIALLLLVCGAGASLWAFRAQLFKPAFQQQASGVEGGSKNKAPVEPRRVYPIPTNINWTLDLTNAEVPEAVAAGSIHGSGFFCERATLQGGNLTLRQGRGGSPDLGVTIHFFAKEGEELSGKSIEITPERTPPLPSVELRWKDDQQKAVHRKLSSAYAMRVAFGEAADKRITGKIYLCLPDEYKSFVAGTFEADIKKAPPPKPPKPKVPSNPQ